jgi:hypothetical protein
MVKVKQKTKSIGGSYETERTEYLSVMSEVGAQKVAKELTAELISEVRDEVLPKDGVAYGTFSLEFSTHVVTNEGQHDYVGVIREFHDFSGDASVTYRLKVVYQFKVLA